MLKAWRKSFWCTFNHSKRSASFILRRSSIAFNLNGHPPRLELTISHDMWVRLSTRFASLLARHPTSLSCFNFQVSIDTTVLECYFKDGVIHGPARQIGMKKFREFRRQLLFIGRYRNGEPSGPCWEYREGGGFVYGVPDDSGKFTGNDIAFIYPDMSTALLGNFVDGVMDGAREVTIEAVSKDSDQIMKVADFSKPTGPSLKYSRATKTSMGENLLASDPYERRMIVCRRSDVDGAGEGLFAVRDLPVGTIAAFYNGVRLPYVLGGPKEEWATSGYKIYVNADYKSGERMNIPVK